MKIIKLDAIDSTNSYLKRLLTKGMLDDLTVVVSKHQTKGKGRNENIWENEASLNLAFSIYKKFKKLHVDDKFMLNVISSLSVFHDGSIGLMLQVTPLFTIFFVFFGSSN